MAVVLARMPVRHCACPPAPALALWLQFQEAPTHSCPVRLLPPRLLQYKKFWGSFGKSVKMGIIEDPSNRWVAAHVKWCSRVVC